MKYPKEAAWWLRPLLERYFEKRKRIGVSEYLFVGRYHLTQNRPVCDTQIHRSGTTSFTACIEWDD